MKANHLILRFFVLVFFTATMTAGCAKQTYYEWKLVGDKAQFYQDSAQCKLMARNAANNVPAYNNQTYHITNYDYGGGYSSSTIEPDYLQQALGGVILGLQQNSEGQETYKLCMQSKGYQLLKTISGQPATGPGGHCTDSTQCPDKMLCDEVRWVCISSVDWIQKFGAEPPKLPCSDADPCPKGQVHDGDECECIALNSWLKKYSK